MNARALVHTWNDAPPNALARVKIEDDSLRDGLQGAYVRTPTVAEKKELLKMSVAAGCDAALLGFPAASDRDFEEALALVEFLDRERLPLMTRFLARALVEDLEPIVALDAASSRDIWADFFIGSSKLRREVEGWSYEDLLRKVAEASKFCRAKGVRFGVSIEDATRSTPEDIRAVLDICVSEGVGTVYICDTVGAAEPSGAAAIVRFFLETIQELGGDAELWWHGHNDRGLGTANALAAAAAGAHGIGGSFLGMGERTGNAPLEQVMLFLAEAGNTRFDLERVAAYCLALSRTCEVKIPDGLPIVGRQAFTTSTGTHAAAIIKAKALGVEFEDLVFSSVPASRFGRRQDILIGPTSGLSNAKYVLEQQGLDASDASAQRLLAIAKSRREWLRGAEIEAVMVAGVNGLDA